MDLACAERVDYGDRNRKNYPSRRYQRCFDVTEQEMADCQAFAQSMEQVIMNMLMDGLITI